ncbi:hypothetical protein OG930_38340 [Streptomyces sp. NBC_01799]|uniref:hypothetical protein n=1 Tax=Streptomyces sp. NBC_01800 TaxID=2975945 RepID=UPI002DDC4238|nr:hypothetical protein [Streptomyces sp. NBC_01800]WSA72442.1 hypothetical protein OIE65_39045 [Streptomyces sp. NBC_01800]WSA80953.1 hypothetical protein OG930_38340 [Streptomyces sp. NBC_01799]
MSRLDPYPFGRQLTEDVLAIGTGDSSARNAPEANAWWPTPWQGRLDQLHAEDRHASR